MTIEAPMPFMRKILAGILFLLILSGCVHSNVVADMASDARWHRLDTANPLPAVG